MCYSKKRTSAPNRQSSVRTSPAVTTAAVSGSATVNQSFRPGDYEEIGDPGVTPGYTGLHKPPSSSSPSSAAAAGAKEGSPVYMGTALYGVPPQPSVTSSNVAADDVNDLTLIDNDLYERKGQVQGQQNTGSNDYECTLIDNDLYR